MTKIHKFRPSHDTDRQESMKHYGFGIEAMKRITLCPRCGAMSDVAYHYCQKCGHPLTEETLYHQYQKQHRCCPGCETVVADNALYCPNCGQELNTLQKEDFV